jgi:RNA polymerase sigma-70 factor (ECF subfamily)
MNLSGFACVLACEGLKTGAGVASCGVLLSALRPRLTDGLPGVTLTPALTEGASIVEVFRRHSGPLIRFARRLVGSTEDAEEIVQEALLRAYANRLRRARRPRELANSVYKITRNLSIDHLRRKRMRLVEQSAFESRPDTRATSPEEALELEALRDAVRHAVEELPDDYREVIALRFGMGLTYRECARTLHIGAKAFEARLHRAKIRLRHALKPWAGRVGVRGKRAAGTE